MGKYFWPVYIAVASVSCALVWRFAPALGARLPPEVRARICNAVDSNATFFSGRAVEQKSDLPDTVEQEPNPPDTVEQTLNPPTRPVQDDRTPAERGVRPVDAIHASWGVLTGITTVERLDGSPIGKMPGGRFFKINNKEKAISTPSGLMVIGTFIPQKTKQTVRIPIDKISCLTGSYGYLSTNQQACLRMYYQLTGEAEALKARLMQDAAKKSPYLQDAANALSELRTREKAAEKLKRTDTDALRKAKYEISQLRDRVQELNEKHKDWKEEHAAEIPDPEKDPAYLEIINRRREYAGPIPGLTL